MKLLGRTVRFNSNPGSRIFTLSERVIHDRVWHAAFYEWEDLIGEWDNVDTYLPVHSYKLARKLYTLANYATDSKWAVRILTPHFNS